MYNFNNLEFNKIWTKIITEEKIITNKNNYTLKCIGLEQIDPLQCDIINEDIYINVQCKNKLKLLKFII